MSKPIIEVVDKNIYFISGVGDCFKEKVPAEGDFDPGKYELVEIETNE